jgi:lipoteichoic acid synthase
VLVLAKALALPAAGVTVSVWTLPAFFWHDGATAAAFWIVDRLSRRSRWMWAPYAAIVILAAANVPVVRALSSPLTMPMLRAAGGPLFDSIAYYVTPANLLRMGAVLAAAMALPFLAARLTGRVRAAIVLASLAIAAAGPVAQSRVDTLGRHRNAVSALVATALPRVAARAADGDWRASPFAEPIAQNLRSLRGSAAGWNVIVVALESTAARYLKPYGAGDDPMPALSALAGRSILVEHAYAVYPESIKGLFAMLCSRDPAFGETAETHAEAACASLPRALSAAGYRTALFHSGRFAYLGMDAVVEAVGFDVREDAGAIGGNVHSSFGVDERAAVERILSWIDADTRARPFFVTYLPIAGHHPYATAEPGPFVEPGEIGAYKNALFEADRWIAALLEGLRSRHLDQKTLVVLYGDHGEAFGQHPGNFGHTLFIYDENIRVPLIFAGAPGASGTRLQRVASVIDIAPTVLDLVGVTPDRRHQGVSLLEPRARMALFYTDYALGWLGLRDGCWKFLTEIESGRPQLYDVCRDAFEAQNLAGAHADRVEVYRRRLDAWSAARRAEIRLGQRSP